LTGTAHGRWYPTVARVTGGGYQLVALARHISASEPEQPGSGHDNWDIETITSTTSGWATIGELGTTNHYPRVHLVPFSGGSLIVNSAIGGQTAAVFFGSGMTIGVPIATTPPEYQGYETSSVLLPLRPNANGVYPPGQIMTTNAAQAKLLDLNNTAAGWQNTAAVVGRNYHFTALLLPDGRVWTAGGNKRAGFAQTDQPNGDGRELRVEIFTPWYYNLSRPTIGSGFTNLQQPPASGTWRISTGGHDRHVDHARRADRSRQRHARLQQPPALRRASHHQPQHELGRGQRAQRRGRAPARLLHAGHLAQQQRQLRRRPHPIARALGVGVVVGGQSPPSVSGSRGARDARLFARACGVRCECAPLRR
ncbi:MAG TPA: hypothetical protein VK509_24025, partial [Polyangiales bacterium]|nr:hypothetical protein [Polyangiales bacterium]